jgi:hypothetical protein
MPESMTPMTTFSPLMLRGDVQRPVAGSVRPRNAGVVAVSIVTSTAFSTLSTPGSAAALAA